MLIMSVFAILVFKVSLENNEQLRAAYFTIFTLHSSSLYFQYILNCILNMVEPLHCELFWQEVMQGEAKVGLHL